jgi:hypothetical protein
VYSFPSSTASTNCRPQGMSFSMLSSAPNIPSQTLRAPDLHPLDTISPLLHTRQWISAALRPTLSIHSRHSTPRPIHPRTRLRTTVHLNRAARHPNTKDPAPQSPSAKHPTPPPRSSQILPTNSSARRPADSHGSDDQHSQPKDDFKTIKNRFDFRARPFAEALVVRG